MQSELNHAAAVRTTLARAHAYGLNRSLYHTAGERNGHVSTLGCNGDHLRLPLVPESSSLLTPIESTTGEHVDGASVFRYAEFVFRFQKAGRFTDAKHLEALIAMLIPSGQPLRPDLWKALQQIEISAAQPDVQPSWSRSCHCWGGTTMCSAMPPRQLSIKNNRPLVYVQAVDEPRCLDP